MDDSGTRAVRKAELGAVHALNQGAAPNVNSVTVETLEHFTQRAAYFRVAVRGGVVAAFLVGFTPGADYGSENYSWFCRNYPEFMCIDRIVVAPEHCGKKSGLERYRDIERRAFAPLLACELNLEPPNLRSLQFHRRFGFRHTGTQKTEGGSKPVSLMIKTLASVTV